MSKNSFVTSYPHGFTHRDIESLETRDKVCALLKEIYEQIESYRQSREKTATDKYGTIIEKGGDAYRPVGLEFYIKALNSFASKSRNELVNLMEVKNK